MSAVLKVCEQRGYPKRFLHVCIRHACGPLRGCQDSSWKNHESEKYEKLKILMKVKMRSFACFSAGAALVDMEGGEGSVEDSLTVLARLGRLGRLGGLGCLMLGEINRVQAIKNDNARNLCRRQPALRRAGLGSSPAKCGNMCRQTLDALQSCRGAWEKIAQ